MATTLKPPDMLKNAHIRGYIKKVLKCCVPQGPVLGPQLYCDYTTPLVTIIRLAFEINKDKTEFLIAGTSHQHAKVMINSLNVSGAIIPASPCVKNLGVIIDSELALSDHVTYICKSCYHYLRNIDTIRPYLTLSSAKIIVHSVISVKLDYCNSLFIDIPDYLITKLQHVQKAAARIVLNLKK